MSQPAPPAPGTPDPEVLDAATLDQLLDLDEGGTGLLAEMVQLFREDTPPRLALLAEALRTAQPEQLGDVAHAVKGAAATMGAVKVRALALLLEVAGRKGHCPEPPEEVLARLEAAYAEALAHLEAFLASRA